MRLRLLPFIAAPLPASFLRTTMKGFLAGYKIMIHLQGVHTQMGMYRSVAAGISCDMRAFFITDFIDDARMCETFAGRKGCRQEN